MKFTIERNWIDMVGDIWQPGIGTCAMTKELSAYDLRNIGDPTRENVEQWVALNAGDFQHVHDFHAVIGETEIPWQYEENELTFNDCIYGE